MTTPANTILTASGGEDNDLISVKCSFLRSLTLDSVDSNYSLASLTDASA